MKKTVLVAILGLAGLGALLTGQGKKGPGVLQPQMTLAPDAGTFAKPMGTMGEKATGFSATTMGASVNGKPLDAKPVTVVGELIDFSCYLQVGKHGDKHRSCGQKCITNGQPIGLLTEDGTVYMLMEEEHDPRRDGLTSDFRKAAAEHLAHVMEVNGLQTSHAGYKAIYVAGYLKK
jgi:hypothetical protein